MKRFVSSLLILSVMATAMPVWADPISSDQARPTVAPLQKGQPAPFTGVLLSPEAVARVIAESDSANKALKLAVQHQADLDASQLKFQVDTLTTTCTADKSILQAQVDDGKRTVIVLNDQLKSNTSGPPAGVWFGLGAATGVVLTAVTAVVIVKLTSK